MSTAIQCRGRPGLATLIEKFPLILFLALLVWLSVQSPYFLSWQNISLMPVSYTHLDVYKRQRSHCPASRPSLNASPKPSRPARSQKMA